MIKPNEIKQKKAKLEDIKKKLKKKFFGIDEVIDRVVASIESWYIMPQALKSPIIINLWGLTGVGKTDLVRSLVKELEMTTKFVEIQMDGYSTTSSFGKESICSMLQSSNINEGETGILLLDEFQRYRTVDEQGKSMEVRRFQDVWMLLSDGKFSTDFSLYTELERTMYNQEYYDERSSDDEDDDDVPEELEAPMTRRRRTLTTPTAAPAKKKEERTFTFNMSYYEAQMFKRLLRLKEPLNDIMKWAPDKLQLLCREALEKRENNEIDYSKLLIFVCGNLDEAFEIASDLENCDTDADVFYKLSKKISVIDIKAALKERFKPEQISRLGNNHVIYPSLNRGAYQKIIRNSVKQYVDFVKEAVGIELNLTDSVYIEIYNNSVYPTQGARPVFSSIHKIFSSAIPTIALWASERRLSTVALSIDSVKSEIKVVGGTSKPYVKYIPIDLDIREQKEKNSLDFNTMVAVHEAGHALVHAILTGYAPVEVNINLASYKGGYMMEDDNFDSKQDMLDDMCICLAGTVSEEIFFGDKNRSSGCGADIEMATDLAGEYYRCYNFGDNVALVKAESRSDTAVTDFAPTNKLIDDLLKEMRQRTIKTITDNKPFMVSIVEELLRKFTISTPTFIRIAKKHGIKVKPQLADVTTGYSALWEKAKKLDTVS